MLRPRKPRKPRKPGQPRRPRRPRRPRSCPDLGHERSLSRRHCHIGDLAHDHAPHETRTLGSGHPVGPGAGGRAALRPVVRRRERREIRPARRPVPGHDGLPQCEYDAEHDAQHTDRPDTPDGGGTPVGTQSERMSPAGCEPTADARSTAKHGPQPGSGPAPRTVSAACGQPRPACPPNRHTRAGSCPTLGSDPTAHTVPPARGQPRPPAHQADVPASDPGPRSAAPPQLEGSPRITPPPSLPPSPPPRPRLLPSPRRAGRAAQAVSPPPPRGPGPPPG